jgi:hypothetical protein
LAFRDYLAARTLFLNCLLPQGAILASTSVEKYFKAIISLKGNSCLKHLGKPLVNALRNAFRELFAALNPEFIEFLERAYQLRYVDDLEKDFNLCISRRKTLAELDFTVAQIENRLVREQEGKTVERFYTKLLKGETYMAPLLWQDNYLLQGMNKKDFIEQPDFVYEVRSSSGRVSGIFQMQHGTAEVKDDGRFLMEALVQTGDNSFRCFYPPYEPQKV